MEKRLAFWNDACKYGALLGAVMAGAYMVEQWLLLSGRLSGMAWAWLLAGVAYVVLLHRFTSRRAALYSQEEGFPFGVGVLYAAAVAACGGVVKGVIAYFFIHLQGYHNYLDKYTDVLASTMKDMPASMSGSFAELLSEMGTTPEPSIVATVFSSFMSNLTLGALLGLVIAARLARQPRPFGPEE